MTIIRRPLGVEYIEAVTGDCFVQDADGISHKTRGAGARLSVPNASGVALVSAVRNTGTFASADILAYNARGVICFLNITAVPGTITVNARIQFKDPASGVYVDAPTSGPSGAFNPISTNSAATGMFLFQVGNVNSGALSSGMALTWRILATHSGAGDFTYSVGYSMVA